MATRDKVAQPARKTFTALHAFDCQRVHKEGDTTLGYVRNGDRLKMTVEVEVPLELVPGATGALIRLTELLKVSGTSVDQREDAMLDVATRVLTRIRPHKVSLDAWESD